MAPIRSLTFRPSGRADTARNSPLRRVKDIIGKLDEFYFLDSPRFSDYLASLKNAYQQAPCRKLAIAGKGYPAEPGRTAQAPGQLFRPRRQDQTPVPGSRQERIKGLVAPHIDLKAGATSYAHAYKALAEAIAPSLFVVLGTDHYGPHRFTATWKGYDTPFGPIPCDKAFLKALSSKLDFSIFEDEFNHSREHFIEFQALWLRYLFQTQPIPAHGPALMRLVCRYRGRTETADQCARCCRDDPGPEGHEYRPWPEPVSCLAGADLTHLGIPVWPRGAAHPGQPRAGWRQGQANSLEKTRHRRRTPMQWPP